MHTACPLVPCACADGSGCRGHTPWQSKQVCYDRSMAMATFSLCSNVATGLLTGMNRPHLSLHSRLGGYCQRLLSRPFEMRGAFAPIVQSTMRL